MAAAVQESLVANGHIIAPVTIAATATKILASRLARPFRQSFLIQNQGATDFYIGFDGTVTAATGGGILLKGGQTPPATYQNSNVSGEVWAIVAAATYSQYVIEEDY